MTSLETLMKDRKFVSDFVRENAFQEKYVSKFDAYWPNSLSERIMHIQHLYNLDNENRRKIMMGNYGDPASEAATNSILSNTTGVGSGVQTFLGLAIPDNLAAQLRNTVRFGLLGQGYGQGLWQIVQAASGALTPGEATEPTSMSANTLTNTLISTTGPRVFEQQISFEEICKGPGPILDTVSQAFRIGELYDEDYLILNSTSGLDSISTGSLAGVTFPSGITSESQITSTNTMDVSQFHSAQKEITNNGFGTGNLVAVVSQKQWADLLGQSDITRILQWPGEVQGDLGIAYYNGIEIRRSSAVPSGSNGSGNPGTTTYHGYMYKKFDSIGMVASTDYTLDIFRDLHLNSTVVKAHWDMGVGALAPTSIVRMVSA